MQESTLIGRADVRATVLPARAAYLVKAGDRHAALTAVKEASTRWAGVTEPIIPVRASGSVDARWQQALKFSNVSGLVNVNLPLGTAETVARQFKMPVVEIAEIDHHGETKFTTHPVHIGVGDSHPGGTPWVMACEDTDLWQSFAAGDYYENRLEDLSQFPVTRLPEGDAGSEVAGAQIRRETWLDAGLREFAEDDAWGTNTAVPAILWVTSPNNLSECIFYWNLRALRQLGFRYAPMALLPSNAAIDWERLALDLVPYLLKPDEVEPDVLICSLNIATTKLDGIGASLGLVRSKEESYSRFTSPRPPLRQAPFSYRSDLDPSFYVRFRREYGRVAKATTHVYRHDTRIEFESPAQFRAPGGLLLHLESDLFDRLPRRPVTASMIHDEATWRGDKLQIPTHAATSFNLEIRVPTQHDTAWALIRDRCTEVELSNMGRMAVRLLELGGHEVLLDSNIRRTIEALRTRRAKQVAEQIGQFFADGYPPDELAEFITRLGETQQRRFHSVRQLRSAAGASGASSAEWLCHQGWAERGLSINCDRCSVRSFVPLDLTQPEGACPACRAAQPYQLDEVDAPELQYRLNGLIDRAADQGVLPHLLAIAALRKRHGDTFLIPGADVVFADGTRREVDLFGIHDGKVVAGEAKNSATGFDEAETEAEVALSAALGAEVHLMVANDLIAEGAVDRATDLTQSADLGLMLIQGETITEVERDT